MIRARGPAGYTRKPNRESSIPAPAVSTLAQKFEIRRPLTRTLGAAGVENRYAEHHARRVCRRGSHEVANSVGRVLPVRVHRQNVRVALTQGRLRALQYRSAFSAVFGPDKNAESGILLGHRLQSFSGAVIAAVHHDPHRVPLSAGSLNGFEDLTPGVVAGNED